MSRYVKHSTYYTLNIMLLAFFLFSYSNSSAKEVMKEAEVNAKIILNYIRYIQWPSELYKIKFCVIGNDPVAPYLREIPTKEFSDIPLTVETKDRRDDLEECNMVYIGELHNIDVEQILSRIEGLPIFSISNIHDFVQRGGISAFYIKEDGSNIILELNKGQLLRSKIFLDPDLINLMTVRE